MHRPPNVVLIEVFDSNLPPDILPEERTAVGPDVAATRRRDFYLGRHCARKALAGLGAAVGPILRGPSREPLWPNGICGSITHCEGYCAAAVARQTDFRTIGIDAEPRAHLPPDVLRMVASPAELERIQRLPDSVPWDLLLFSAKESVYKAWFPLTNQWLGFDQAEVDFSPRDRQFSATLRNVEPLPPGIPRVVVGHYEVTTQLVFTSVFIT